MGFLLFVAVLCALAKTKAGESLEQRICDNTDREPPAAASWAKARVVKSGGYLGGLRPVSVSQKSLRAHGWLVPWSLDPSRERQAPTSVIKTYTSK